MLPRDNINIMRMIKFWIKLSPSGLVLFFLSFIVSATNIYAHEKEDNNPGNKFRLNKLNFCRTTPKAENDYEPEVFETTNNLLRETGQKSLYCGEKIIIAGKVVDQDCVPVGDAKVYLWQVGCKGQYPYAPLKNNIDNTLIHIDHRLTFTGNGTATTNNNGEFHFVTVYPHSVHQLAPHVNLRVEHHKLGVFQTRLMLKGYRLKHPEYYPELDPINKIAVKNNTGIYYYQVVISGNSGDNY